MWSLQMSMFLGKVLPVAHNPPNVMTRLLREAARTSRPTSQRNSQSTSPKFSKLTGTAGGWKEEGASGDEQATCHAQGVYSGSLSTVWRLPERGWRKRWDAQAYLQLLGLLHSCCNSTALTSCPPAGPAVVTCNTQHLSRQASLTHPGAITKGPRGPRLTHA